MNKKIVIVIPNEHEVNIPVYAKSCNYHAEGIRKFIYEAGLDLHGKEILNINTISIELAKQGYIIMNFDSFNGNENIIVYLPNKISLKQLEYFEKRKEQLKNYNISFCVNNEHNEMNIIDETTTNSPIIDELLNELNNRLIIDKSKNKILKKKDINTKVL